MRNIFWVIILISIGIFFYNKYQTESIWTLMVCETKMGNGVECQDNSYVIPGFSSLKECMLEGASKFSKEGFECGRNCKKDLTINICSEVCNQQGCTK